MPKIRSQVDSCSLGETCLPVQTTNSIWSYFVGLCGPWYIVQGTAYPTLAIFESVLQMNPSQLSSMLSTRIFQYMLLRWHQFTNSRQEVATACRIRAHSLVVILNCPTCCIPLIHTHVLTIPGTPQQGALSIYLPSSSMRSYISIPANRSRISATVP